MKNQGHPPYTQVLFIDSASGHRFVCGSTLQPKAKEVFEGVEYPVVYLSISSTSHPFFTGSKQLVDSAGRVEKFNKRFGSKKEASQEQNADQEASEEKEDKKEVTKKAPAKKPAAKKR